MTDQTHTLAPSTLRWRSKLRTPRATVDHVERAALAERIARAGWAQLTVLQAASGFGKSVALVDAFNLMQANATRCIWITLDPEDSDAGRFLSCLLYALDPRQGSQLRSEGETVAAVFDLIESHEAPLALFLDEAEHLIATPSLELVREIVATLPEQGRVLIASRSYPQLGQSRLRAMGRLLDISDADLRFSFEETQTFLKQKSMQSLTLAQMQSLHASLEGWPVALRLAATLLKQSTDIKSVLRQLSQSGSALSEFLASEVLQAQPAEVQEFLLTTAVLRDLDPALCDHLYAPGGSAQLLEQLVHSNVPISRQDGAELSYRYHAMFARFLQDRLRAQDADQAANLHRTAMRWYMAQDRNIPAIEHAVAGRDFDTALTLIAETGRHLLEQGRVRLLSRWFDAIPLNLLEQNPEFLLQKAWANLFRIGPKAAQMVIDNAALSTGVSEAVSVETLCLRTEVHSMLDELDSAIQVGEQALDRVHLAPPFTRSVFLNALSYAYFIEGNYDQAKRILARARIEQSAGDDIFNIMFAESVQGLDDLRENRLREAMARFRVAANTTRSGARHKTNGNLMAGIPLACCLYERNDLQTAAQQLRLHLPFVREIGPIDHLILCYTTLSRIAHCQGDTDSAFTLLTELEAIGHRQSLPRVTASARLERARIHMQAGELHHARETLASLEYNVLWGRISTQHLPANDLDTLRLHKIRLGLLEGTQPNDLLQEEIATSRAQGRLRRLKLLELFDAALTLQQGDASRALRDAGRLFQTCAREGYLRTLVDDSAILAPLIHAVARKPSSDPQFQHWLETLLQLCPPLQDRPQGIPLDPLTPKEIAVLKQLELGHSNAAIGTALSVSDSTVRTHLRNINTKLATSSRGQAVATARQIGLL